MVDSSLEKTLTLFRSVSVVEEIEQMNGLFQQKQRELLMAVSRVEELSKQLETLRSGKLDEISELERLYKELQVPAVQMDEWMKSRYMNVEGKLKQ